MRNSFIKIIHEDFQQIVEDLSELDLINSLKKKTILITGANGFLPAYMADFFNFLNEKYDFGIKLHLLVRDQGKALLRLGHLSKFNTNFIVQDIAHQLKFEINFDYIIHAASQASPVYFKNDPVGTLLPNSIGTLNLLNYAKKFSPESFLFFSSGEVYGVLPNERMPILENDCGYLDLANVRSCYGESKRFGEVLCVSFFYQYGIKTKIVRPFHTYGPGMSLNDGRVFADFTRDIINKENLKILGDGLARRPYCYLADATKAFILVLLKGESPKAYNVGNPDEEYSVTELANKLVGIFSESKLNVEMVKRKSDDSYLTSPISRNTPNVALIKKLGWRSRYNIESGFKRTVESFL